MYDKELWQFIIPFLRCVLIKVAINVDNDRLLVIDKDGYALYF